MNKNYNRGNAESASELQQEPKLPWNKPTLIELNLQQTESGTGAFPEGGLGSLPAGSVTS